MREKGSLYMAIFFLLLGVYGIIQSIAFQYWEAVFLPLFFSSGIFIMSIVVIRQELRHRAQTDETPEETARAEAESRGGTRRLLQAIVWSVGFAIAIYLLGFRYAPLLWVFAYLKWRRRGWLKSIILAVAMAGFIYFAFEVALGFRMYRGIFFGEQ